MASLSVPVRPEQIYSPIHYPQAAKAARRAARLWFTGAPTQTLASWRDTARLQHCTGLPDAEQRSQAFDAAFAYEVGQLIVGGFRHE